MGTKQVDLRESRRLAREKGPEIAARYEAGETYAAIARSLGLSKVTVKKAALRNGAEDRSRMGRRPAMETRAMVVRERYEAGESLAAIGESLGISFATARMDLLAAGGETRSQLGTLRYQSGPENPSWKGGSHIGDGGYRWVWIAADDEFVVMATGKSKRVLEHRLVMARHLGRPLLRTETVHHINGDRLDNRIENLQLRGVAHGQGVALRCHDCGSQNVGPVEL